jgi:hypothetical protein
MVTCGIAIDRRLSQFEAAAAGGDITSRKDPMLPMRALSFTFMGAAPPGLI